MLTQARGAAGLVLAVLAESRRVINGRSPRAFAASLFESRYAPLYGAASPAGAICSHPTPPTQMHAVSFVESLHMTQRSLPTPLVRISRGASPPHLPRDHPRLTPTCADGSDNSQVAHYHHNNGYDDHHHHDY